jgi:HPt (histidine-containing phosphotransfer) domain-containing protein
MNNNETLLIDVLRLTIQEAPRLGRSFATALTQGNLKDARRSIHTLKSNSRQLGLKLIADFTEQLEQLARDERLELLQPQAARVVELAEAIADWAEDLLSRH